MAKCEVCSKDVKFGLSVSHSNRKTNRMWKPNIRKVKVVSNGTVKSANICTRCLRSNKVTRAI
jgi:large subunit ribosomal protein L28